MTLLLLGSHMLRHRHAAGGGIIGQNWQNLVLPVWQIANSQILLMVLEVSMDGRRPLGSLINVAS
jgi:hypothetical protein